jgi:hypothetical protein
MMNRDKLLSLLTDWWIANGWSINTLHSKADHQLFGIYNRAVNDKWRIKGNPVVRRDLTRLSK